MMFAVSNNVFVNIYRIITNSEVFIYITKSYNFVVKC